MSNRVYLSGPMAGIYNSNYAAFAEARDRLRGAGYDCYDPSEGNDPTVDAGAVKRLMRGHVAEVLRSDSLALLPGYERSEGSKVELAVALAIGIPIYFYRRHRPQLLEPVSGLKVVTRAEAIL